MRITLSLSSWVSLGLLLASCSAPAQTIGERNSTSAAVVYEVKPGDTLWSIAHEHFGRSLDWFRIRDINSMKQPDRIYPRQKLMLYRSGTVFVFSARGEVWATSPNGLQVAVATGMMLDEGVRVSTGENSFVTLELPDASRTTLPSHSSVRVLRTDKDKPVLRLESGGLEARVPARMPPSASPAAQVKPAKDSFRVESARVTVGVRGTNFRVSAPGPDSTTVGVLESSVVATSKHDPQTLTLSEAQGVVATDAMGTLKVQDLLAAPAWQSPAEPQRQQNVHLAWQAIEGASNYRIMLGKDIEFQDLIAEQVTGGPTQLEATLVDVPEGTWFARVSAIAPDGLEGLPATQLFSRELWRITDLKASNMGGAVALSWAGPPDAMYELEISDDSSFAQIVVRQRGIASDSAVLNALAPGRYWWRVTGQWTERGGPRSLVSDSQILEWRGAR